jgi:hypothetical protein
MALAARLSLTAWRRLEGAVAQQLQGVQEGAGGREGGLSFQEARGNGLQQYRQRLPPAVQRVREDSRHQ